MTEDTLPRKVPAQPSTSKPARAKSARGGDQEKRRSPHEESPDPSQPKAAAEPRESESEGEERLDDETAVGEIAGDLSGDLPDAPEKLRLKIDPRDAGLSRYDPLTAYLSEVQRHTLLTPEEEHSLAVKYQQTGDVKAAARMVTANLRLVVKIAYEYRRAYRNLMDLIQEGNIGLMQAVKRYDPYRGVKLSSYAAWWIRAYILRYILNNWRLVKLGTTQTQRKLFFNLNKEKQRLLTMGVDPTSAELALRLDVPESEVIDMDRRLSGSDVSLDAPVGDSDGRPMTRIDMMPGIGIPADDSLASEELGDMVKGHLARFEKTLTGKDVTIFRDRLMADEPVTLQEIGDRYGISRERVRQLEKRLQDKLRVFLKSEMGEAIQFG